MPADLPELTDGVVTLRAHTLDDVDEMVRMGSDPETTRWTTAPVPFEASHAREWVTEIAPAGLRDGAAYRWAIEAPDGARRRFAGNLDLRLGPPPDLGYALAPWASGSGVMARAVRLTTAFAFTDVGLPVVHWSTYAGNFASWRVAHACGFTFHGARPLALPQRGALHDAWDASLRPGDEPGARTTWWSPPVLEGTRVRLRSHTEADLPRIIEGCSDERTRHWLPSLPHPYTEDRARDFVLGARLAESLGQKVSWVIADLDDDRMLGNVSVFGLADPMNPTAGEIGYWAHPDARGRGIMREAVELVLAHAFTSVADGGLGRHRVQLGASWGNASSRHIAEKTGFTLVGRHRQDGVIGVGDAHQIDDGAWYDLLAEER